MAKQYGNESISRYKDEQQVRQRPGVMFGTDDAMGCAQSAFEIIANSIDEAKEGYGDSIIVEIDKQNIVTVTDFGRGVPLDWNKKEEMYNWELVYCTLYGSGKYDDDSYGSSLGLNGLGATATQFASEFMEVTSIRDGKKYVMHFEKGRPVGELSAEPCKESTGTVVRFRPDIEVFKDINIPLHHMVDALRKQAMLLPKVKFIIRYKDNKEIVIKYDLGIAGYVKEVCTKNIIDSVISFNGSSVGRDSDTTEEYEVRMNVAMTFDLQHGLLELYHNNGYLEEGGVTDTAIKTAVCKVIEEAAKKSGKLPKNAKIVPKDIEDTLVAVGATECPGRLTSFKHQTKTAISNAFIKKAFQELIIDRFSSWGIEHKEMMERVVDLVLTNRSLREKNEEVKKKVLKQLATSTETVAGKVKKLIDCESDDPAVRELYIVEGDSAKGGVVQARYGKFQSIMPLRGKILNCAKKDLSRIIASDIIVDLIRVLGCGIEARSKTIKDMPKFDANKLKYGKIIICTDADVDGMHIRCLVVTMLYVLVPEILKRGKVFIVETPLYTNVYNGNRKFCFSEKEQTDYLNDMQYRGIDIKKIKIKRSKGLGENNGPELRESTMDPKNRKLIPVEYDVNKQAQITEIVDCLMGNNLEERKRIIEAYFDENRARAVE